MAARSAAVPVVTAAFACETIAFASISASASTRRRSSRCCLRRAARSAAVCCGGGGGSAAGEGLPLDAEEVVERALLLTLLAVLVVVLLREPADGSGGGKAPSPELPLACSTSAGCSFSGLLRSDAPDRVRLEATLSEEEVLFLAGVGGAFAFNDELAAATTAGAACMPLTNSSFVTTPSPFTSSSL
jgi:hypothetical protein